ncbi:MAG: hypothetical protein KDA96_27565, partial [Planctomycetaceae bacterium]|nr:hypothetical protein [Planctomycetaceae bacterium]
SVGSVIRPGNWFFEAVRVQAVLETVTDAIQSEDRVTLEFRSPREDRHLAMIVNPIRKHPFSGVVIVVRDISDLRRIEAMRRDFVSGVSHELKTPLTVIQACTDTLLGGALDDREAAERFLKQIEEQSERLRVLVLGMLQLSRVESGVEVFRFEDVPLSDVIENVFRSLRPLADADNVQLRSTGVVAATVWADHRAVETILNNLVSNAIKNSPANAEVTVTVDRNDDEAVRLIVADQGGGIDPQLHDRIFERFYRVDRDRSRDKGGTGLGLAIVKHVCQTLGATVTVDSRPGRGARFVVTFNAKSRNAAPNDQ